MQQAIIPGEFVSLFKGLSGPTIIVDSEGKELGLFVPEGYELPNGKSYDDLHAALLSSRGNTVEEVWKEFCGVA